MKNVEMIRARVIRGQQVELARLRQFISMTEGNNAALAKMEGDAGRDLLAGVTDYIMARLGHVTIVGSDERTSKSRRAATAATKPPKGK